MNCESVLVCKTDRNNLAALQALADLVLFICGKYHYMNKTTLRRYATPDEKKLLTQFVIAYPDAESVFFRDLEEF